MTKRSYDWTTVDATIRQMRDAGATYRSIATALNKEGLRTPYGKKPNMAFVQNATNSARYRNTTRARTVTPEPTLTGFVNADASTQERIVYELLSAPFALTSRLNAIRAILA